MSKKIQENKVQLQDCDWYISEYTATEENNHRIDILRKVADDNFLNSHRRYSNGYLHDLADKLELCNSDEIKCGSPACKKCNRAFQIERVNKIVKAMRSDIKKDPKLSFGSFTLIEYERAINPYDFVDFNVQMDKERVRKLFRSSGVVGPILGSLEFDFHRSQQLWLPHYHLLVPLGEQYRKPLKKLCKKIAALHPQHLESEVLPRPTMIQNVKDALKQVSYIHKLSCFEVRDYKTSLGNRRTKKYRLDDLLFSESLCWINEVGRRKMLFEYGARGWLK